MHPRMLARDSGCSGGTCPAVYDDDPDLPPDELAIVGNQIAPRLLAKLADRIAPHEGIVAIKREIVAEALRPADEPVDLAELMAALETFSYSAFRLEGEQVYADTGRDDEWAALAEDRTALGQDLPSRPCRHRAADHRHGAGTHRGIRAERRRRRRHRHHPRRRWRSLAAGRAALGLLAVRQHPALRDALRAGRRVDGREPHP